MDPALWALAVTNGVTLVGLLLTARNNARSNKTTTSQSLIDDLAEQLRHEQKSRREDATEFRAGLAALNLEVGVLRRREIIWITHTANLTQQVTSLGAIPVPLPVELSTL